MHQSETLMHLKRFFSRTTSELIKTLVFIQVEVGYFKTPLLFKRLHRSIFYIHICPAVLFMAILIHELFLGEYSSNIFAVKININTDTQLVSAGNPFPLSLFFPQPR